MVALSVNVNKVATLRNSRGGSDPDLMAAVEVCLSAGAPGITVHPRQDERHITKRDVLNIADRLARADAAKVEFNIEGDPRPDWLDLVCDLAPTQATLVPVRPGEVTSEAGWDPDGDGLDLGSVVERLQGRGVRVSVFVDARPEAIHWASSVGADRVELYTEPFAAAHAVGMQAGRTALEPYLAAAALASQLGLGVNAGHDLNLDNLPAFLQVPDLSEVSIGHALMSRALFVGLDRTVREYLAITGPKGTWGGHKRG